MAGRDYTLDFTGISGIPSQWGIDTAFVTRLFHRQTSGLDGVMMTPARSRGVFNVVALTAEAATILSSFKLNVEKDGKKIVIPLRERRRRLKPPVWGKIRGSYEPEMREVGNAFFDGIFKEYGADVVEPTKRQRHHGTKIFNGMREVLFEVGENPIPRRHNWTDGNGETHEWTLTYRGQPFECRGCGNEWHANGKCPKWIDFDQNKKKAGPKKFLVFSDSIMRLAQDTDDMRFDAIPGAKLGHVANHMDNDRTILPDGEVVIVATGRNIDLATFEETKASTKIQAEELIQVLRPFVEAGGKAIFLLDPVVGTPATGHAFNGPSCKERHARSDAILSAWRTSSSMKTTAPTMCTTRRLAQRKF